MGTKWLAPIAGSRLGRRIADAAVVLAARRRVRQLDALDVSAAQEAVLRKLVRTAQDTRFGVDHDFRTIRSVADYQARVPVRSYEAFWDHYWNRDGQYPQAAHNATWPGRTPYYALSSGTTSGTTKYIPVTHEMVKSNRKAGFTTMAFFRDAFPKADTFAGKLFFLGGSTAFRPQADGSFAGDLSGIAAKEIADAVRPYTFPPLALGLLSNWEEKLAKLSAISIHEPITAISGVPSWMLKLFDSVLQASGKKKLIDVWPMLKVVIHGGTKFDSFRNTFREVIGSDEVQFCEVYPASEGFIATQDFRSGLLRVVPDHDVFFEFVPMEYFNDGKLTTDRPTRHTLANLEPGVVYAVLITSCSGIWSYLLGDTVRFESRTPPLLRFTGRTKNFLSAFGEHLIEEEVEKAVAVAAAECGVLTEDHHVGPVFPTDPKKPGHHLYLIEFRGPPPADLSHFAGILDRELCKLNEDYDAHRIGDLTMLRPVVQVVPTGGFGRWMASRGKAGGQNKVPRMDNTGTMTADIAKWMGEKG